MFRQLLTILSVLISCSMAGQEVTFDEAVDVANNHIDQFFPGSEYRINDLSFFPVAARTGYYIAEVYPEGWIMISGEKELVTVPAFSFEGEYIAPGGYKRNPFNSWVNSYSDLLTEAVNNTYTGAHESWSTRFYKSEGLGSELVTIDPIIEVEWDQGSGWNRFCPEDESGPGGHTLVGCVAVAMAQALTVFSVPDTAEGEHSYLHSEYGNISADFSQAVYKWDSMSVSSSDDYNALLLYHCAVSVEMDFGPEGSSAQTSKSLAAMRNYFRMSHRMNFYTRKFHQDEWFDLLLEELMKGNPIIYKGDADDGEPGHAFNIDGVINSNYFHLNWGWGGRNNGYFLLNEFTPGTNDFTKNHAAVFGLQPYYYPTGLSLDNNTVPEEEQPGAFVGEINVEDEATDNEYIISLICDSVFSEGLWVKDFYIENDSLKTGRVFQQDEKENDTILFIVEDRYDNIIEVAVALAFGSGSGSVGIQETRMASFSIYPNPASDMIIFNNRSGIEIEEVSIYSMSGNRLRYFKNNTSLNSLSLNEIQPGLLILEIIFADGVIIRKKIIKSR